MPVTEKQSTEVAVTDQPPNAGALATLSSSLGLKPSLVKDMVKSQCFKNKRPEDITDTQLAAYISTANAIREVCPRFNPLLPGMLYAYPNKNGGIDVMMGPDCVFAMLSTHPDYDGSEHEEIFDEQGNFIATTVRLYLKSSQRPRTYTAYLDEWQVMSNPNWKDRPRHMLFIRATKQCARQIIHGLPFDAEEMAISHAVEVQYEDVTAREKPASRADQLAGYLKPEEKPAPGKEEAKTPAKAQQAHPPARTKAEDPIDVEFERGPEPGVDDYLPPREPEKPKAPDPTKEEGETLSEDLAKVATLSELIDKVIESTGAQPGTEQATPGYWCEYYSAIDGKKGVKVIEKFMAYAGKDEAKHKKMMDLLDATIQRVSEAIDEAI